MTRRLPAPCVCLLLLATAFAVPTRAADPAAVAPADKIAVVDGHVVHDVGEIWNHVSNWGLIGSAFSFPTSFSDAPSAQWPKYSGNEYLWAAGLWVGGVVLGEPLVSTAGFRTEFSPTPAAGDTIFATFGGAPGGNRYPWPDADDDGDGQEDEEILNGLDDDLDGLVDEDFAAIGDQHFVCGYNDSEPALVEVLPDHDPLGLKILQQSFQWADPLGANFIGYDFTITNAGAATIDGVYVGMFSDFDIGRRGDPGLAADDYAGFHDSLLVRASDGSWVPVQVAWMRDGAATGALDGYVGWVLCGHTTAADGSAPGTPAVSGFSRFSGQAAFGNGGDPTNDAERYQALSRSGRDPDVPPGYQNDYRVLTASGPFVSLAPGESLVYRVALVIGAGMLEMLEASAEAVLAGHGRYYDRDGDPTNGAEFHVPWLRGDDIPVAAAAGRLQVSTVGGGAEIVITATIAAEAGLQVTRRAGPGVPGRRWSGHELVPDPDGGTMHRYRLRDDDPVGWPRRYELSGLAGGAELVLDQAAADRALPAAVTLRAGPNPFNPQVNLQIDLPRDADALLQVFDIRGRLVDTLLEGRQEGGTRTLTWDGRDRTGRTVPSGVYHLRLTAAGESAETRVTLVR